MDIILILGLLLIFLISFYNLSKKVVNSHDPLIKRIKADMTLLDEKAQYIEFYSSDESYTEDKTKIYLCLKDENQEYYHYNMLMYVAIHELAHALTQVIDPNHETFEFNDMFNKLLEKASVLKIYDPSIPLTTTYCNVDMSQV